MPNIYILRSIPVQEDSRVMRFSSLARKSENVKFIQWGGGQSKNVIKAPLPRLRGKPFFNIFLTPLFMLWLFFYLLFKVKRNDLIISIDMETGISAYFINKIKGTSYIFDVADPFSIGRLKRNFQFINAIEQSIAMNSIFAIVPNTKRAHIYNNPEYFKIIENVPLANDGPAIDCERLEKSVLKIGYFGTLELNYRCLEVFVDIALRRNDIQFIVGGGGEGTDFFKEISEKSNGRVIFIGAYTSDQLSQITLECDILLAAYSTRKIHHQYVAANKLYEHLFLGKAVLTNKGTNFSEVVSSWGTGWIFDEDIESIEQTLEFIINNRDIIYNKGSLAKKIWIEKYSSYWTEDFYVLDLKRIINGYVD